MPPSEELTARIRAELTAMFAWRASFEILRRPLLDLGAVIDLDRLAQLAKAVHIDYDICFTIISINYIKTGLNWIAAMKRLGRDNIIVIAGDHETVEVLGLHQVNCIVMNQDIHQNDIDTGIKVGAGFSIKGLAMVASKFPVARFLVGCGYNVFFSDADAVWLRDPVPYLGNADIVFQRIAMHPRQLVSLWGFAACTGLIVFRRSQNVMEFLDQCVCEHLLLNDDQIAMNLALLKFEPAWFIEGDDGILSHYCVSNNSELILKEFAANATHDISGTLERNQATLLALRHDRFWRHGFVKNAGEEMVVAHPNSPKNDDGKMTILASMGLRFSK